MFVHREKCDRSHKNCNHVHKNRHHCHLNCDSHKNKQKDHKIKLYDSHRPSNEFIPNLKTIHHETKCLHSITANIKTLKVDQLKSKSPLPVSLSRPSQIAAIYSSDQPIQNEEGQWVARVRVSTDFIDKTSDTLVTAIHEPIVRALGEGQQEIKARIVGLYDKEDGTEVEETLSLHHQEVAAGTIYTPNHKTQSSHIQRNWTGFLFEVKSSDGPFELVQEENPQDALLTFNQRLVQPGEESSTPFPICFDLRGYVVATSDDVTNPPLPAVESDYALALNTGTSSPQLYQFIGGSWATQTVPSGVNYLGWNARGLATSNSSSDGVGLGYQMFELRGTAPQVNLIAQHGMTGGDVVTDTLANNATYTFGDNNLFILQQSFELAAQDNLVDVDTNSPADPTETSYLMVELEPNIVRLQQWIPKYSSYTGIFNISEKTYIGKWRTPLDNLNKFGLYRREGEAWFSINKFKLSTGAYIQDPNQVTYQLTTSKNEWNKLPITPIELPITLRGYALANDDEVTRLPGVDGDYALIVKESLASTLYQYGSSSTTNPWTKISLPDSGYYLGWNAGSFSTKDPSILASGPGYQIFDLKNNKRIIGQNYLAAGDKVVDTNANGAEYTLEYNNLFVLRQQFTFSSQSNLVNQDNGFTPSNPSEEPYLIVDPQDSTETIELYQWNQGQTSTWVPQTALTEGDAYIGQWRNTTNEFGLYLTPNGDNDWTSINDRYKLSTGAYVQSEQGQDTYQLIESTNVWRSGPPFDLFGPITVDIPITLRGYLVLSGADNVARSLTGVDGDYSLVIENSEPSVLLQYDSSTSSKPWETKTIPIPGSGYYLGWNAGVLVTKDTSIPGSGLGYQIFNFDTNQSITKEGSLLVGDKIRDTNANDAEYTLDDNNMFVLQQQFTFSSQSNLVNQVINFTPSNQSELPYLIVDPRDPGKTIELYQWAIVPVDPWVPQTSLTEGDKYVGQWNDSTGTFGLYLTPDGDNDWTSINGRYKLSTGAYVQTEQGQDTYQLTESTNTWRSGPPFPLNVDAPVTLRGYLVSSASAADLEFILPGAANGDYALVIKNSEASFVLYQYDSSSQASTWTPVPIPGSGYYLGWNAGALATQDTSILGSGLGYQIFDLTTKEIIQEIIQGSLVVGLEVRDTNANDVKYTLEDNNLFVLQQQFTFSSKSNLINRDTNFIPSNPSEEPYLMVVPIDPTYSIELYQWTTDTDQKKSWVIQFLLTKGDAYIGQWRNTTNEFGLYLTPNGDNDWTSINGRYKLSTGAYVQSDQSQDNYQLSRFTDIWTLE